MQSFVNISMVLDHQECMQRILILATEIAITLLI